MAKKGPTLPQRRFQQYMQQRVAELGGNITKAGEEIGLKQGYASMLFNGQRNAGPEVIEKAIEKHGIRRDFFRDPTLDEPSYRYFVEGTSMAVPRAAEAAGKAYAIEPAEHTIPIVYTLAVESGRLGQVTPVERAAAIAYLTGVQGAANEGGLTVDDVVDFVETLRSRRASRAAAQSAAGAAITNAAKESAAAKGIVPFGKPPKRR